MSTEALERYVKGSPPAFPESQPKYLQDELTKLEKVSGNTQAYAEAVSQAGKDTEARLTESVNALTKADAALVEKITTLESSVATELGETQAQLTSEVRTRATADEALSEKIEKLTATVKRGLSENTSAIQEEARVRSTNLDTVATKMTVLTSSVEDAQASILTEQTTRASQDSALASSISTLSTTVSGHTTSISQAMSSINGVSAKWGIKIDNNGTVTGLELLSGADQKSSFTVKADSFAIKDTSGSVTPFIVDTNGVRVATKIGIGSASGGYSTPHGYQFEVDGSGIVWAGFMSANETFFGVGSYSNVTGGVNPSLITVTNQSHLNAHAFRAKDNTSGGSAIAGVRSGHAFYAEAGGYGPFTGSHDACVVKGHPMEAGDIVEDVRAIATYSISDTFFEVQRSTTPYSKRVLGVALSLKPFNGFVPASLLVSSDVKGKEATYDTFPEYNEIKDTHDLLVANALGEGQINVCGQGGDIQAGDLIVTSSIPGKGMKQADDIVRSYTVAKARESVTFSSPTETKLIACIYMCG